VKLNISSRIRKKLQSKTPPVTEKEIEECFLNRTGGLLLDTRPQHQTKPPTKWFIAHTNRMRCLKIAFIKEEDGTITIKSAFDPDENEIRIFYKYS
jgi:hypothetical protein